MYIIDDNSNLGVFVNSIKINKSRKLECGDLIFINGIRIIYLQENIRENQYIPVLLICVQNNLEIKLKEV